MIRIRPFALVVVVLLSGACDTEKSLFPSQGTLRLSVVDSALVTQGSTDPGNQVMSWTIETAELEVDGEILDYVTVSPCEHIQVVPLPSATSALPLACDGAAFGFSLTSDVPVALTVRLGISAMTVRRAERPELPAGSDFDGDRVPNEGDNCVLIPNADQVDSSGNGVGDACSLSDANGSLTRPDRDGDGVTDALDNCLWIQNLDQLDAESDGIGDACDRTAVVDLPTPLVIERGPMELILAGAARTAVSLDFDDEVTLSCDAAFATCTLDPGAVVLVTP